MKEIFFKLFSIPELLIDGMPVSFHHRKSPALLAYLLVTDRTHTRAELVEFLWPELEENRGRANLRLLLAECRKAAGMDLIACDGDALRFISPEREIGCLFHSDYDEFIRKSESSSLQELVSAAELYSSGFLKGFTISRAATFEDWQFETGQILEARYCRILEKIFYLALKDGDSEAAREWGENLISLSPFREDIIRKMMQLEVEQGDFNAALRYFRRCKRSLAAEGFEPEDETLNMAEDCEALKNRSSLSFEGIPENLPCPLEPVVESRRRFFRFRSLLLAGLFVFVLLGGSVFSVCIIRYRNRNREPDIPIHIAVLSFKFLCDQEGVEKHAEFFSSELISTLAEDGDFSVVPHYTARRYRDSYLSVREIADELDVDYILDGAAMADREIVRFSVQLIDTELDECIWSRTCECENSYDLTLQTDVILEMERGIRQALFE